MAYVEKVMNEYRDSLRDLNCNSKPLINVLTMLAEENEQHAPQIVKVIEDEILKAKANRKLPVLYLIDSIIKNLPTTSYKSLFSKNLVQTFTSVFEQVDEKTRASMFKLRQTWTTLFPNARLYGIDVKIKTFMDPAWPITATAPEQTSIHVNPRFLTKSDSEPSPEPEPELSPEPTPVETPVEEEENSEEQETLMRQQLIAKQQELLKLQQERLELELAEAKVKLNKQKKKNAGSSSQSSSMEEPALPDTTVPPAIPETAPPPRDPRTTGRDPHTRDPRLKGKPQDPHSHISSHIPHSTTSGGSNLPPDIPDADSSFAPPFGGVGGLPIVPSFSGPDAIPPPFMQPGHVHINPGFLPPHHVAPAESHFTGEVYHPDSSANNDARNQDTSSRSSSNKPKIPLTEPTTNQRDPRQTRKETEQRSRNSDNSSDNRSNRDSGFNRHSGYNRNFNRNSKERDRDPRQSRSPHSSSISPRSSDGTRDSKTDSKSRDPRLRPGSNDEHRKQSAKHEDFSPKRQDGHISPNSHKSPIKQKSPFDRRDGKRQSKDREKSPDSAKSPKYIKTADKSDSKTEKDKLVQSEIKTETQTAAKEGKIAKRSSKERSISPSKHKVRNKNENAKQSGSVESMEMEGKDAVPLIRTPKRELEKDEQEQEENNENSSKKPRIDVTEEKPVIMEGADVLGKIQEDISELFGGEDQDYRPVDQKGLPLKSPSCKGWDKFKADHPDQYAYDIELKKQRSESMDVDQRPPEEPQDTDYRINRQPSWPEQTDDNDRRASTEEVAIPIELSMEHHADILIQAHKHLQEGKMSHEQHQALLQQLGELMKIQKLQEENRRLSTEAEKLVQGQPSEDEDIRTSPLKTEFPVDRDLRKLSPQHPQEDVPRLPSNIDGTPPGPQFNRSPESREKMSPEKLPIEKFRKEKFQKEGSPQKATRKGIPEFERQGPLHNLYPEKPKGPPSNRRLPQPPHQINLPTGHPDYRGPHPGPLKRVDNFRGPPDDLPLESAPPFDAGDNRAPRRDPDFREPGRDGLPPVGSRVYPDNNMGRIPERDRLESIEENLDRHPDFIDAYKDGIEHDRQNPPEPFFEERTMETGQLGRMRPFDGPGARRDMSPLDRGDIGSHDNKDFRPLDEDNRFQIEKPFGPPDRQGYGHPDRENMAPPHVHEGGPPDRFDNIPLERRQFELSDRRDFDYEDRHDLSPHSRMSIGPPDRRDHGPPDRRDHGPPDRRDHGPPDRRDHRPDRRELGPFDRRNQGPPDQVGRGFPNRRDGSPDKRDWGPPDRIKHAPDGMGMGPPGMRDHGLPDGMGMGPPGRRDGPPDGMGMGPPGRRDGPPDGMGMGPPGRRDRHPDGMGMGPPGRRDGPPDEMGMAAPGRRDGPPAGMGMGHPGRRDGPPDGMGMGHPGRRDGPPDGMGMGPPGRRDHEPPDRDGMGPPNMPPDGWRDRMDMIPPGRRDHAFLDRRDHEPPGGQDFGPPDRMDMEPPDRRGHRHADRRDKEPHDRRDEPRERDFGPPDIMDMGPHDRRNLGPPDRRHIGPPDRRGMGPDRQDHGPLDEMGLGLPDFRDNGPPGRRNLGPPDRMNMGFPERREFGPPDKMDMGPPDVLEHGPPDRKRMEPPHNRDHGPPERRDMGHNEKRDHRPLTDRGDHGPPDRLGKAPPEFRDNVPPEFRDHGPPDRRDHRPPDRMFAGPPDRRGHGPPDRMGMAPHDKRDNRPPDWRDHVPPDRRDPGPPDGRFHENSGPLDRRDTGTPDRHGPGWPLGGKGLPFNPGIAELEQTVPERRTPPIDVSGGHIDPDMRAAPFIDDIPKHGERLGCTDRKVKPSDKLKADEKAPQHDDKVIQGRKSPLLPTPADEQMESQAKQDEAEVQPLTESQTDIKPIPALLEMDVKPTPDLTNKNGKEEPNGVDHNTGLGPWQPVKLEPERPHSPDDDKKPHPKNKRDESKHKSPPGKHDNDSRAGPRDGKRPPSRRDVPPGMGPDIGHPEGKRPPNRRDGPQTGPDMGPPEGRRHPNRRDGPPMGPDMVHPEGKRPNRRDGPPGMGPDGHEGNRPPNRRDGPPMMGPKFDGNRPPNRWDGPLIMGPDGPRPPFPPGPRGPLIPHGPIGNGPRGPPPVRMGGPDMSFPDMEEDQRWTSFSDMGPEITEEVVIGNKNYAIKLGDRPRIVRFFNEKIEVYADPSKRGIVIDGNLMYKFGERVKEVDIRGRTIRMFYHGKPVNLWIDGQNYEVRVDAPPRNIEVNGKNHKIQIDGRDMMILIDKSEKGIFGGPPRFIYIDEDRMELRFDPPPRHILIDGKLCELMLSMKRPCVNIEGKLHGIRFDGPPREVVINNQVFNIHTDRAVKVKVANKLHYIALGGPCHELIVDGKWFEMKFDELPKEINVGNKMLMVHLPGKPPEVKILPEILPNMPGAPPGPLGNVMMGPGLMRPLGPGMEPMMRPPGPLGPNQRPLGPMAPNERLSFPMMPRPEMIPLRPEIAQPGGFPINRPPLSTVQQMVAPFPVPGIQAQARPIVPQPPVSTGLPNVFTGLFGNMPQPSLVPGLGQGPAPTPVAPAMDINTLLSKLIATGIIKKEDEPVSTTAAVTTTRAIGSEDKKEETKDVKAPDLMSVRKKAAKQDAFEDIPDMREMDISHMKELRNGVIQRLYVGIQCTTCGVRFMLEDEEKTEVYREHLDWHFRQNRREKDEMKVAKYRQWFYGVNDWIQYEEITDTEETGRSMFFERQQNVQTTPTSAPSNMSFALITVPEGATVTRCPAASGNDSDDLCAICHEPFEQFWDEEHEEWHLRDAIRVNDQTYHPICYEDHTDVSEGTPSPSTLPMLAPDFSDRKVLSYDETSQDTPNTSFEGDREVVKTEPAADETDSKMTEDVSKDVIVITESPVKKVSHATVKSEPMETSDSAIVMQENDATDIVTDATDIVLETVVKHEPVTHEPVSEQSSNTEVDSASGTTEVKTESKSSEVSIKDANDQEMTESVTTSQEKSDPVPSTVVMATEVVAMVTDSSAPNEPESVNEPESADPEPVIGTSEAAIAGSPGTGTSEAVAESPATEGSGGSTPVQDERSCTPVKDECPGTPVQDEPMVE